MATTEGQTGPADPVALLRSRSYLVLLALAAILGVPISAAAYGFLVLVDKLQGWTFKDSPQGLGFDTQPRWWPLPVLAVSGISAALAIRYLPGRGGHSPADRLVTGTGPPRTADLPGVFFAAVATPCGLQGRLGARSSAGPPPPAGNAGGAVPGAARPNADGVLSR